jgi:hypothetical protein
MILSEDGLGVFACTDVRNHSGSSMLVKQESGKATARRRVYPENRILYLEGV